MPTDFFVLMDPDRRPGTGDDVPPLEAVIGAWPLVEDGDVLVNPGGPVPFRLTGDFLRETMFMSDEDVAGADGAFRAQDPGRGVEVLPWLVGEGR